MNKPLPVYIIPKRVVRAAVALFICMFIMMCVSTQASYYFDRKSNQRWCGVVTLFTDTYKELPPPSEIGKKLNVELIKLKHDFKCRKT